MFILQIWFIKDHALVIKLIILIDVQNCRKLESFIISNFKRTVKSFKYFRVTCKLNLLIYVECGKRHQFICDIIVCYVLCSVDCMYAASTVQLKEHLKDFCYVAICRGGLL